MLFTALTAVFAALASVGALPVDPTEDVVITPPVTYPTLGTVWTTASNQTVTWDTSAIPAENRNETGLLLLGYLQNGSENLNLSNPLATQFLIGDGEVSITVPDVSTRMNYIVVLFGDSGNVSPEFTIVQA